MSETKAPGKSEGPGNSGGSPHVNIQIDREHFQVEAKALTGAELRALPEVPIGPDRDLFQVVPGGQDLKIESTQSVALKSGMRFFTAPGQINPGVA